MRSVVRRHRSSTMKACIRCAIKWSSAQCGIYKIDTDEMPRKWCKTETSEWFIPMQTDVHKNIGIVRRLIDVADWKVVVPKMRVEWRFKTLRPGQNGRHFADIFKSIF